MIKFVVDSIRIPVKYENDFDEILAQCIFFGSFGIFLFLYSTKAYFDQRNSNISSRLEPHNERSSLFSSIMYRWDHLH